MKQKTTQALYSYWNEVRQNRIAPRRFEIEPARIAAILAETFILERVDGETYRYRLAGTRICEQFGFEFRGANFLDGWNEVDRAVIADDLARITTLGGVSVLNFEAAADADQVVAIEAVLLPLVHTNHTVDRFLGAMTALDPPAWVGSRKLLDRRLTTHEIVWPDGRPHPVIEQAAHQAPFRPTIRNSRLVRSDRRQFRVYDGGLLHVDDDKS